MNSANSTILFDGVCVLCERSVQFIIRHDPQGYFQFATLQSAAGSSLVEAHGDQLTDIVIDNLDSFLLLQDGKTYIKS